MKAQDRQEAPAIFLHRVVAAVSDLKVRLQRDYERTYSGLEEIIRIILDEEEAKAWKLSIFPRLLLPDLLEAHAEALGLKLADPFQQAFRRVQVSLTDAEFRKGFPCASASPDNVAPDLLQYISEDQSQKRPK